MKRLTANDRLKRALRTILAAAALTGAAASAEAQFGTYNVSPIGGAFGMGRLGGPLVVADYSGGYGGGAAAYGGYAAPYVFPSNAGFNTGFTGLANTGTFANPTLRNIGTPGTGVAFNSLATGPNFGVTDPLFGFQQGRVIVNPVTGAAVQQSVFPSTFPTVGTANSLVDIGNSFPAGTRNIFGTNPGLTTPSGLNVNSFNAVIPGGTFVEQSQGFPVGVTHFFANGVGSTVPTVNGPILSTVTRPGGTFVEQSQGFPIGVTHFFNNGGFSLNNAIQAGVNFGTRTGIFPTTTNTTTGFGLATSLPRR